MVWMHVRKTRSSFLSDACASGWGPTEAGWWWQHMWHEAVMLDNGTALGSPEGELDEDSLWLAQQTMPWWQRLPSQPPPDTTRRDFKFLRQVSVELSWLLRHGAVQKQCHLDRAGGVAANQIIHWFATDKRKEVLLSDIRSVVSAEFLPVKERKQRFGMYEDDDGCTQVRNANRIDGMESFSYFLSSSFYG